MSEKRPAVSTISFCIVTVALSLSFLFCASHDKLSYITDRIENLGIFGESRKKSVIGQDGCTPIELDDKMMWTFGDTIIGTWKGDLTVHSTFEDSAVMKGMISNSLAFTDIPVDSTIKDLEFTFYKEQGTVAQFIKPLPGEDPSVWRFWAMDGIKIDTTVYVYYMLVFIDRINKKKQETGLPIRVMGVGIAEWNVPDRWKPGDPVAFKRTARVFFEGEPVFGDAVVRRGNLLFLIGHGPAANNRVPAFIARVQISSLKNRSGYEFLDAEGHWSGKIKTAAPIADDVMGEPSLSYSSIINEYVVLYCSLDGKIKEVSFSDFNAIKNKKTAVIYTPPSLPFIPTRPRLDYYSGKEIFSTSRALYAIYINPAIYQPVLLRIPYHFLKQENRQFRQD